MSRSHADQEIDEIERHAIGRWLSSGDGLVCARCGGIFIPSQTSDDRLCAMCVPLKSLRVGDRSPQYAKCEVCGKELRGKRSDVRYCGATCKKAAYRERQNGNQENARDGENSEDIGQDIGRGAKGGQTASEEGFL